MGKGSETRARARKLAKKHNLPPLAPVPKKQPSGRVRRPYSARDKSTDAIKTRCKQMGKEVTPENMRAMRAEWWGCRAGRVIGDTVMPAEDRADLWEAVKTMRRTVAARDAAMGLPKRHPACMRLLAASEATSEDSRPVDARTDAEKLDAANRAWMAMHGWLGYTDKAAMSEALRVVIHDEVCADPAGLLSALHCVSDGIKGERLSYRGRG